MSSTLVSGAVTDVPFVVDAAGVRTDTALPTTSVAYAKGDLLILSASNVLTLATDPAVWDVIAADNVTAAQSVIHAAAGREIAIYTAGAFNVDQCRIGGTVLASNQKAAARAKAIKNGYELRKVVGGAV